MLWQGSSFTIYIMNTVILEWLAKWNDPNGSEESTKPT